MLDLYSKKSEFVEKLLEGFGILRKHYTAVVQGFRMILRDWDVQKWQLESLYERFFVNVSEAEMREKLFMKCDEAISQNMTSYTDKLEKLKID